MTIPLSYCYYRLKESPLGDSGLCAKNEKEVNVIQLILGIVFLILYAVGRNQGWVRWLVTVFLVLGIVLLIVGLLQLFVC